jgi:hypothetical protein
VALGHLSRAPREPRRARKGQEVTPKHPKPLEKIKFYFLQKMKNGNYTKRMA